MGVIAGSAESGLKQNKGNEEPTWDATMNFLKSNDTNYRRKPAQVMPDCGLEVY